MKRRKDSARRSPRPLCLVTVGKIGPFKRALKRAAARVRSLAKKEDGPIVCEMCGRTEPSRWFRWVTGERGRITFCSECGGRMIAPEDVHWKLWTKQEGAESSS